RWTRPIQVDHQRLDPPMVSDSSRLIPPEPAVASSPLRMTSSSKSLIKEQPGSKRPKMQIQKLRQMRQASDGHSSPKTQIRSLFTTPPSTHGDSDLGDSNDLDLGDGIHRSSPWHPTPSSHNPWQSSESGHDTTNNKGSTRTLSKSAPMIVAIPSPNRDRSAAMGQVGSKPKSPGIILFIHTNLAWPDSSSWNSSESCWAAMHAATTRPLATHQASDQRPPAVQPPIHDRTRTSDRLIEYAAPELEPACSHQEGVPSSAVVRV
ncbi:hypothetical protein ACLOJK_034525, partial [Asimina triloba]